MPVHTIRQIGLVVQVYADDWDDLFPRCSIWAGVYSAGWAGEVYPYLKNRNVYSCPVDQTKATLPASRVSYYYNLNLAGRSATTWNSDRGCSWKQAELTAPDHTVVMWEASNMKADVTNPNETTSDGCDGWHYGPGGGIPASGWFDYMNPGNSFEWINAPTDGRHLLGANYVAADGHATWLLPRGRRGVSGGEPNGSATGGGSTLTAEGTAYADRHELTLSPK